MCYFLEPHGVLSQCVFITVFILQKRKLKLSKDKKGCTDLGLLTPDPEFYAVASQSAILGPAAPSNLGAC